MRRAWLNKGVAGLLSVGAVAAAAQQPGADPTALVSAGLQVAQLIDAGHSAEVWEGASAAAKKLVARQDFVRSVSATRQPLGAVQARGWLAVARHESAGTPQLPAGSYVNVEYQTSFASGKSAIEMVSFRLDDDKTWRVTGYFLR